MSDRLTDRQAVFRALHVAMESEYALIDAYRSEITKEVPESEQAVIDARRNIAAWQRILRRYYGSAEHPTDKKLRGARYVPINEIWKQS